MLQTFVLLGSDRTSEKRLQTG